jgi:hypothetical protein
MRAVRFIEMFPALLVAASSFAGLGCDSRATIPEPSWPSSSRQLPSWTGVFAREFDDNIERIALHAGLAPPPHSDVWFGPRAQAADHVLRVRVVTTTTQGVGARQGYRLTLRVVGQPLGGPAPPSDTFEVVIPRESASYQAARLHDIALTGKTFVGFFKLFSGVESADLHWYLTAEAPDVLQAVHRARLLSEVGHVIPVPRTQGARAECGGTGVGAC